VKRRLAILLYPILSGLPLGAQTPAQSAPVFVIAPDDGKITFYVKASVALSGEFRQWDATLKCASTDPTSCALDLKVQAASVSTGSGMKDDKLKSKRFFNVKADPLITFKSTKVSQHGPNAFDVAGVFTIRGVSRPETLTMMVTREGPAEGQIKGQMAFDRREYGMTSGIPFIKIADRVEVNVDLKVKRVSGPPLNTSDALRRNGKMEFIHVRHEEYGVLAAPRRIDAFKMAETGTSPPSFKLAIACIAAEAIQPHSSQTGLPPS
jgi:polyisoprenoid-binding protein YceI